MCKHKNEFFAANMKYILNMFRFGFSLKKKKQELFRSVSINKHYFVSLQFKKNHYALIRTVCLSTSTK